MINIAARTLATSDKVDQSVFIFALRRFGQFEDQSIQFIEIIACGSRSFFSLQAPGCLCEGIFDAVLLF